ncbi:MAG: hypothetical protein RSA65_00795 [Clostridia bacterium]
MRIVKRLPCALLALMLVLMLCGCARNQTKEQLYQKLMVGLREQGYACTLSAAEAGEKTAIYDASVWDVLTVGEERVLVYFDESNRADYLCSQIDQDVYGYLRPYGLRFILHYRGSDAGLLSALKAL